MSENNKMVKCPFNPLHEVLPNRLAMHLRRCSRNQSSPNLARCPYFSTHLYPVEEISEHILNCPNRPLFAEANKQKNEMATTGLHQEVVADEDWDAEPPVETYKPLEKCKEKFVVLNPRGLTASYRRAARQRERQRWIDNDKLHLSDKSDSKKTQE